jgi:hypothetical protein
LIGGYLDGAYIAGPVTFFIERIDWQLVTKALVIVHT